MASGGAHLTPSPTFPASLSLYVSLSSLCLVAVAVAAAAVVAMVVVVVVVVAMVVVVAAVEVVLAAAEAAGSSRVVAVLAVPTTYIDVLSHASHNTAVLLPNWIATHGL